MSRINFLFQEFLNTQDTFTVNAFIGAYRFKYNESLSPNELFDYLQPELDGYYPFVKAEGQLAFHKTEVYPYPSKPVEMTKVQFIKQYKRETSQ